MDQVVGGTAGIHTRQLHSGHRSTCDGQPLRQAAAAAATSAAIAAAAAPAPARTETAWTMQQPEPTSSHHQTPSTACSQQPPPAVTQPPYPYPKPQHPIILNPAHRTAVALDRASPNTQALQLWHQGEGELRLLPVLCRHRRHSRRYSRQYAALQCKQCCQQCVSSVPTACLFETPVVLVI